MGARRPLTELYCHLVWATWDRIPLITPDVELRLYGAIRSKLLELTYSEITIGGMPDHLHVVCRYPPVHSVAALVQLAKGSSSHFATHELPGLQDFKWQGGYGAFSLDPATLPRIRQDVLNQKQRHQADELWLDYEATGVIDHRS